MRTLIATSKQGKRCHPLPCPMVAPSCLFAVPWLLIGAPFWFLACLLLVPCPSLLVPAVVRISTAVVCCLLLACLLLVLYCLHVVRCLLLVLEE